MRLLKRKPPPDLPAVDRTGETCQRYGHQNISWGNPWGWCSCCEHTVHNGGRVLYYGEFYRKVPPHDEAAEQRTAEWAHDYVERQSYASKRRDEAALELLRLEQRRAFGIDA